MKKIIEDIFLMLRDYGLTINFAEMVSELEATKELDSSYVRSDLALALEADYLGNSRFREFESISSLIRNHEFDNAFNQIERFINSRNNFVSRELNAWIGKKIKASGLKQYLSSKASALEKKWGLDIIEISLMISKIKTKIDDFKKLYQELDAMSKAGKGDANINIIDKNWIEKAASLLANIRNFFIENAEKANEITDKPVEKEDSSWITYLFSKFNKKEVASKSEEIESKVKQEKSKSSWGFSLDPRKWFENSYSKSQPADAINNSASSEEAKPSTADLGSDVMAKNIHTYYHSLITFAYTGAKAACFAQAISNIQRISNDCAISRTKEVENQFAKHVNPTSLGDDKSLVVTKTDSKALAAKDDVNSFASGLDESIKDSCQSETEMYFILAENCDYIFSENTSIDGSVGETLSKAATVNANINEKGEIVLFDSEGLEVHMTYVAQEFSETKFLGVLSSASSSILQIGGQDETLKITDGTEL